MLAMATIVHPHRFDKFSTFPHGICQSASFPLFGWISFPHFPQSYHHSLVIHNECGKLVHILHILRWIGYLSTFVVDKFSTSSTKWISSTLNMEKTGIVKHLLKNGYVGKKKWINRSILWTTPCNCAKRSSVCFCWWNYIKRLLRMNIFHRSIWARLFSTSGVDKL